MDDALEAEDGKISHSIRRYGCLAWLLSGLLAVKRGNDARGRQGLTGVKDCMGKKDYWFPARRHGYGWGPPVRWQGWLAVALFLLLQVGAFVAFPPARDPGTFVAVTLLGALALMLVCVLKGEPLDRQG